MTTLSQETEEAPKEFLITKYIITMLQSKNTIAKYMEGRITIQIFPLLSEKFHLPASQTLKSR